MGTANAADAAGQEAGRSRERADPLTLLLGRQSGVLTRTQALRHISPASLKHRVASGHWQRGHHGVYVAHNGPLTGRQRLWVAYLSLGPGAYLAGATAAHGCGLRGHDDERVHVLIPVQRRERTPPADVLVHRTSRLTSGEVDPFGEPPYTRAARSLVDAAQWSHSDEQARAIIAAGVQQRLATPDGLAAVVARLTRVRRRRLILEAITDARCGAHSLPESEFLRLLRRARLPLPLLQVRRIDRAGRVRYLDGYYEQWQIHIEIDGGQHMAARQYWRDMARQNDLWVRGDRVLRFPAWAVRHHPAEVAAQVSAALRAAGWRP